MNVVMCGIHLDQDIYFTKALKSIGHDVYFYLGPKVKYRPTGRGYDTKFGAHYIKDPDFMKMDAKNMAIVVQCMEQEDDVYTQLVAAKPEAKVIHIYGNNITEAGRKKRQPKNMIALDLQALTVYQHENIKNMCYIQPAVTDKYTYSPIDIDTKPQIYCYINEFHHPYFTEHYRIFKDIVQAIPEASVKSYGSNTDHGLLSVPEFLEHGHHGSNQHYVGKHFVGEQIEVMKQSWMTIHIKRFEGYGFNVVKSLAMGRPVITTRDTTYTKTLSNLCLDGITAIVGENKKVPELVRRIKYYIQRPHMLQQMSLACYNHYRNITDMDYNLMKLEEFMDRLA